METITAEIYLVAVMLENDSEPHIFVTNSAYDHSPNYVVLGSQTVTFPAPNPKVVSKALVSGLEEKVVTMRAAAEAAINEVQGQIQSLLALEHVEE